MKKFINISLVAILLMGLTAQARTQKDTEREKRLGAMKSDKYPFEPEKKNIPPFVRETRFKMSIKQDEVEEVKRKLNNFTEIMNSTKGMEILQKPVIKHIKTIDTLYFHPSYWTTIMLPVGSKVSYARPSFELHEPIAYSQNIVNIKPDKDFLNGNIIIYYSKDGKNYHLNIIAKNYTTAECKVDQDSRNFLCDDKGFGIVYNYTDEAISDDTDVFFAYVELVGSELKALHKKGFGVVIYNGNTYYIIKDKKFGKIFYRGSKYRIASRL